MSLPVRPPLEPMLAKLSRALPDGYGYVFERKWDGFRALAFVDGHDVDVRSRNDRPFSRYFPEVVDDLAALGASAVVDGEILARRDGRFDFGALLGRLHPAASRVALLAATTPASFVAFDLLAVGGEDLREVPFLERRRRLDDLLRGAGPTLATSPLTPDRDVAAGWLAAPAEGTDGVVAKLVDSPYRAGKRTMVKVKPDRTVDAVVAGFRLHQSGGVGSLLLGLFDDAAELRHVGIAGGFSASAREELARLLAPRVVDLAGHPWELGFALEGGPTGRLKGAAGRWSPDMVRDWHPVAPSLVAEVAYDQVDGVRFRHPARFRRWRPDRDADSCRIDQLSLPHPPAS